MRRLEEAEDSLFKRAKDVERHNAARARNMFEASSRARQLRLELAKNRWAMDDALAFLSLQ